jgi:predicted enzyme related to lactoylglutathione lyase
MDSLLKVDNIMFRVGNLRKSATFYEKMLGLKKAWTDPRAKMVGFQLAESDSEIVIHDDPEMPNPDFSFLVRNVERFCAVYTKKGGAVIRKPFDVRCGRFAVLADPDGNEINIVDLTKFGNKPRYGSV